MVKNGDRHCMGRGLQGYEVNQTQISELSQGIIGKEWFTNRKSWLSHIFFLIMKHLGPKVIKAPTAICSALEAYISLY